jgi:hypothetical protein
MIFTLDKSNLTAWIISDTKSKKRVKTLTQEENKQINMKKDIGISLALYPTPLAVVGAMVNGKLNYTLVGHLGIIGHGRIIVSLAKPHYTNQGIKDSRALTV